MRPASGSFLARHQPRQPAGVPGPGIDPASIEQHVSSRLGTISWIYRELVSDLVRIDVLVVPPAPERPYTTLVTTGMSGRPMNPPPGSDLRFAELAITLPPSWPVSNESLQQEKYYWPLRWLKDLARQPHLDGSWHGEGRVIPNGGPPAQPLSAYTKFCALMLRIPRLLPAPFRELKTQDGSSLRFLTVLPIHAQELAVAESKGPVALEEILDRAGVSECLEPTRKSACP